MKISHRLKDQTLIIKLPKVYDFQHAWNYFTNELPSTDEFQKAKICIIDGTKLKELSDLGISGEIFKMRQEFLSKKGSEFILCGFGKSWLQILKMNSIESTGFPKHFETLEEALNQ